MNRLQAIALVCAVLSTRPDVPWWYGVSTSSAAVVCLVLDSRWAGEDAGRGEP